MLFNKFIKQSNDNSNDLKICMLKNERKIKAAQKDEVQKRLDFFYRG